MRVTKAMKRDREVNATKPENKLHNSVILYNA